VTLSLVLFVAAALLFVYAVYELWPGREATASGMPRQRRSPTTRAPQPFGARRASGRRVDPFTTAARASQPPVPAAEQAATVSSAAPALEPRPVAPPPQQHTVTEWDVALAGSANPAEAMTGRTNITPVPAHMGTGRGRLFTLGICVGLFVFAVTVRWWGLPGMNMEMWGDEAQLMGEARKFIDGTYTTPFLIDHLRLSALYEFVMSFPLRLSGMDVTVARGYSGILGALSVPLLYLTARELGYSRRVGIVAGVALATTFWDMLFSRFVLPNIMAASAGSVAVLLMVLAVRRSNVIWAVLAGVGVAYALNAHLSGFFVVPLVAAWLVVLFVGYSRWWQWRPRSRPHSRLPADGRATRVRRHLLAFVGRGNGVVVLDLNSPSAQPQPSNVLVVGMVLGVTALLTAWPLLQLYFGPGSSLNGHASDRLLLAADNRAAFASSHPDVGAGLPGLLWYQLKATAGMFFVRGEPADIFGNGRPLLDPFSSLLFSIGFARAVWSWRRPAATLTLLWLIVPIFFGTFLTTGTFPGEEPPSIHRSIVAAPAICLCIALGLEWTFLGLTRTARLIAWARRGDLPVWRPSFGIGAVALAALLVAGWGLRYDADFYGLPAVHAGLDNPAHEWALFLAPRGAIPVTVVAPVFWPLEYSNLYAPQAMICSAVSGTAWQPCPPTHIVIFNGDQVDAMRYATATGLTVKTGPSYGAPSLYWYAENRGQDRPLPDPGHVLGGLR